MKKITKRNYFSVNNGGLSNTKLKDYKKDKRYFFERYISGRIEKKITDAMIIGAAVDCWAFFGKKAFEKKYTIVTRRSQKCDTFLNQTMYNKIEKMATKLLEQTAMKELRGFKKQKVIQTKYELGEHFHSLIGIPDAYKIDGDKCIIFDLKTAENLDPDKYRWKIAEYGYDFQLCFYRMILKHLYPLLKKFEYWHLVMEKDSDEIYNCQTFTFEPEWIEERQMEILTLMEDLRNEKKFLPYDASFKDNILLEKKI